MIQNNNIEEFPADGGETQRFSIENELLFIELKPEVSKRLDLPKRVPILKADLEEEYKTGVIPPSAFAAGVEALKLLQPNINQYDTFLARYYLLEGRRAIDAKDLYEAQRFYQKALDLNRNNLSAEAAFYLAALSEGDPEQAMAYYRRSIELNPQAATPHFELARILRERRDLQGALNELNQAAILEPNSAAVLNQIAETYLLANDLEAARVAYRQAVAIEPTSWVLLVKLGITEYDMGEYRAAIKDLRTGLDAAPDEMEANSQSFYVQGLYYLGLAYRESGDKIRSRKLFTAVLGLAPDHAGASEALS